MESNNIFNESLNEIKSIKENLKKQVEIDYIKENEHKLNTILDDLLIKNFLKENEEGNEDVVDSEETETGDKKGGNIDMISAIINSIDMDKALTNSDVEATEVEIDTEGEPAKIKIGGDQDVTIDSAKDSDYTEDDETPTDTEGDIDYTDEYTDDSEEKELEEYFNKNSQLQNPETEEMIQDDKTSMDDKAIQEMLKEIETDLDLGEQPADQPSEPITHNGSIDEEEMMNQLSELTEEEIDSMINELIQEDGDTIDLKDSEDELSDDLTEDENADTDPDLEEGMSAVDQTKKMVGTSTASTHAGRPERRSNMNETFKKELEKISAKVEKLVASNKNLSKANTELKNINESQSESLAKLKTKLYEAALVSHKTAYVNQLFLENSLTQKEKNVIIEAFSKVETIDDSKLTFGKLNESFSGKKIMRESIEDKITKTTIQSGAGIMEQTKIVAEKSPLNEQIEKMKFLSNYKPINK